MEHEFPKFRLVIHAKVKPRGTYTYIVTRGDDPYWSEMGAEAFETVEEAAEAGRLVVARLEARHRMAET
jgi:hypothetical protein